MIKIAVVTATRAEYGILTPLIRRINQDKELELELIVTGTHLREEYGYTKKFIVEDGFPIAHEVDILESGNSAQDISNTVANAIRGFAHVFSIDRPEMVVILGDRTEMLGVAIAAMNERIPIAHIHGGEVTEGAVDDCVRHALTKMSYLHFAATEIYRKRIIQLGENPERVFNVGSLGTENILHEELIDERSIRRDIGIPEGKEYAVVTFHPVTLENNTIKDQITSLCDAMCENPNCFFLITKANADQGGEEANQLLEKFVCNHPELARLVSSLGMKRYLSAVKHAAFVLGNSSSGIIEAPVIGTPTVNIGDRQQGRLLADTIVCCDTDTESIQKAIDTVKCMPHKATLLYGNGETSEKIVNVIKDYILGQKIYLKKSFYDLW